jgi:hypothetical protein
MSPSWITLSAALGWFNSPFAKMMARFRWYKEKSSSEPEEGFCLYTLAAIPPPALSGSGSRVENLVFSSQPSICGLPVQVILFIMSIL